MEEEIQELEERHANLKVKPGWRYASRFRGEVWAEGRNSGFVST